MNSTSKRVLQQGFSLTELVVVIGTAAILSGLLVVVLTHGGKKKPSISPQQARARQINCVNNLKQLGLAYRIWEGDNGDKFPMAVLAIKNGEDTVRNYQVMSNELSTPRILVCPADTRKAAVDFTQLKNQNISYFVGLDAQDSHPQVFLSGDRNIKGPAKPRNGVLNVRPGDNITWTAEMHENHGNVGLSDGSVQWWPNAGLQKGLQDSGDSTNVWRLALPE